MVTLHLTHRTLSGSACDLGIDFTADVHDESQEVQPEHQDDDGAKASIGGIVTRGIPDIEGENVRSAYKGRYGKEGAGHDPCPSLPDVRSEDINNRHPKNNHHKPNWVENKEPYRSDRFLIADQI